MKISTTYASHVNKFSNNKGYAKATIYGIIHLNTCTSDHGGADE